MAQLALMQINKKRRMVLALPPPPTPSAKTLVKALLSLTKAVASCGKPKFSQHKNATNFIRRIELLTTLFEELRESTRPIPPSVVIVFRDLHSLMQKGYMLLEECRESSTFWLLMEQETYGQYFHELSQSLGKALSALPFDLLDLSEEDLEQIAMVRKQVLRSRLSLNPVELQLREDLISTLKLMELKVAPNPSDLMQFFSTIQLLNARDCETEIHRLEELKMEEGRKEDLKAQQGLANLVGFVRYGKYVLYSSEFEGLDEEVSQVLSRNSEGSIEDSTDVSMVTPPAEFLCPITLDLMRDPVIVATGQTYDKTSITRWIGAGNSTCPKTGQKLAHQNMICNFALKSLISLWCEENNVPFEMDGVHRSIKKGAGIQHIAQGEGAALEAMQLTAKFLIQKLHTGNQHVQKLVARELRLLSKSGPENRICIAEAGGISILLPLLSSSDAKIQEHAVTTLLNISIQEDIKKQILAAGALDVIVDVLISGHTMEARENAAAALFSLSGNDEVKVLIGGKLGAIPALVTLLREGSGQRGKRDAATALFNLAVYHGNKAKIVEAGAVPALVVLLSDESPLMVDACAAVLALLATFPEGVNAIRDASAISVIAPRLRHGSPKGREYATSVLLAMCKTRDRVILDDVSQHVNTIVPDLYNLLTTGTLRAKRKAGALLKLLRSLEASV